MEEMIVEENVVETKIIRVPKEGFEDEYDRAVERKETIKEELKKKFEKEYAEKTEVIDQIIELTSYEEEIVVEVPETEEETPVEE